jgi:CheY-like chemotaxis protein
MAAYRVLIVEDQRDVRRMLRSGLETLSPEINVVDVPSAEEAILIMSRQPIDLLITDVFLPGISGLELKDRSEVRNPNIKLVLMTGMTDPKVRRQVANSGADAFFFKPLQIGEFLDTVRDLLDLAEPEPPDLIEKDEEEAGPQTLSEGLAILRERVKALAAVLLDERGEIMAQTGSFPAEIRSETFLSAVVTTCRSALNISQLLGEATFRDLMFFNGQSYDVVVSNVSGTMVLLLAIESAEWKDALLSKWMIEIRAAVDDLVGLLAKLGVSMDDSQATEGFNELDEALEADIDVSEVLPELEAVFEKADDNIEPDEVDAFWDSLVKKDGSGNQIARADAISFDQAQQLGLAPEDEGKVN